MTASTMAAMIGKTGTITVTGKMRCAVTISDVREMFGRVDYLCAPVKGEGEDWFSSDRFQNGKDER